MLAQTIQDGLRAVAVALSVELRSQQRLQTPYVTCIEYTNVFFHAYIHDDRFTDTHPN